MANGGLAFIDRRTGFNDVFEEDEVAFYTEREEFFDKLNFFKKNPEARQRAARKGYQKIHTEFNEVTVTREMMRLLTDD